VLLAVLAVVELLLTGDRVQAQTPTDLFLHGIGPDNNPPTLVLDQAAPTAGTAKFRDSASVNFSGGNPWKEIGAWPAAASLTAGTLTALSDLHVWLGLKNSDDQGTQFDLRAEVLKNGTVIATGLTRCITGIVRNAANAKEAIVVFGSVPATPFNGTTDTLSIKLSTRIGTNPDDTKCPGHNNAVGLRLYFDATSRSARFDATMATQQAPTITSFTPTEGPVGTSVTITGTNFDPVPANNTVKFNGVTATVTAATAASLTATVPTGATTGPITVTTAAGTATSTDPFTILAPPVLSPVGNQTVPLGSTLTFTVTATDPNNDPLTFSMTPLPLPAHATFQAQTGLFTFTPDAGQVGTLPLTVQVNDGIFTVSEAITITVTGAPPGGVTSLTGRIDDTSQHPLANVAVTLKGTALSTTTDAQGVFTLTGIAGAQTGRQVLLADGRTAGNFAVLAAPVDVIPNVTTVLSQPLTIPPIDMSTAVTVNPAATTVLSSAATGVTVTIAPNSAKNPDGTPYTGSLTLSPVPEYGRPESRPVELKPGLSVTIQPAGVLFNPPATITFPNVDHMAVGNELDLWSLSPDTGTFEIKGRMQVSADGSQLLTTNGGVQRSAWHFALPPSPVQQGASDRQIGHCVSCSLGSEADLAEGALSQPLVIPGLRTLGVSRDLRFQYRSTSADVQPIIPLDAFLDARAAVPSTFSVRAVFGGIQLGDERVWNSATLPENTSSLSRIGFQLNGGAVPTGQYPFDVTLFSNYPQSSIGGLGRQYLLVRNERSSPFGAGWTLEGVDRLLSLTTDRVVLAEGGGPTKAFLRQPPTTPVN
jgi:hypothetical protein